MAKLRFKVWEGNIGAGAAPKLVGEFADEALMREAIRHLSDVNRSRTYYVVKKGKNIPYLIFEKNRRVYG